jgi:hypothetical protein
MKLLSLIEDYHSGPMVFPTDAAGRAQAVKGPLDFIPHKNVRWPTYIRMYKQFARNGKKRKR